MFPIASELLLEFDVLELPPTEKLELVALRNLFLYMCGIALVLIIIIAHFLFLHGYWLGRNLH